MGERFKIYMYPAQEKVYWELVGFYSCNCDLGFIVDQMFEHSNGWQQLYHKTFSLYEEDGIGEHVARVFLMFPVIRFPYKTRIKCKKAEREKMKMFIREMVFQNMNRIQDVIDRIEQRYHVKLKGEAKCFPQED